MVVTQLIPESRGGATNQCQQPAKWVKSFVVALVILALLGLGDSPARFAHQTSETAVLATGDRFEVPSGCRELFRENLARYSSTLFATQHRREN
jgi:hypothetical protein